MMTKTGKEKTHLRGRNENGDHLFSTKKREPKTTQPENSERKDKIPKRMLPAYGLFTLTDARKVVLETHL